MGCQSTEGIKMNQLTPEFERQKRECELAGKIYKELETITEPILLSGLKQRIEDLLEG
jgi:hypothetical protein